MNKKSYKPDYKLKSELIKNGLYNQYKRASFDLNWYYCNKEFNPKINVFRDIDSAIDFLNNLNDVLPIEYKECGRLQHAEKQRKSRIVKKIRNIISSDKSLFLTFTFNDKTLSCTSEITRRRYVARWLKSNCIEYVANIDYGKQNDREHYHAVVSVNDLVDYTSWNYGTINGKLVRNINNTTPYKLRNYINKLTNHAIKNTTKQVRLIYSRKVNN